MPEPIDVVYTWVDTSDPAWQAARCRDYEAYREEDPDAYPPSAAGSTHLDELRYSLRSLQAGFPGFRRLFLVTNGQRPAWLADVPGRLSLITHDAILGGPGTLPTYNSQAIESALSRIPGLAERFLYLNDDFFLDDAFTADDFFDPKGRPKVPLGRALSPKGAPRPADEADTAAHRNANRLLDIRYGRRLRLTVRHQPRPLTKSALDRCEATFPDAFRITRRCRFRSRRMTAVHNCLVPFWAYYSGQALLEPPRLGEKDMYVWTNDLDANREVAEAVDRKNARAFCVQGHTAAPTPEAVHQFTEWMDRRYPEPSEFEKA